MVLFVFRGDALQNLYRVGDCRLVDLHRLEAALERGVLLDGLVVFLERSRADALKLASRKRGLEDVRGIHRALRAACAHHRVDLVEEEDHVAGAFRLVDELLEALLELAAVLRSRHHPRHVYRDDALRLHLLGDFAAVDRLRKPFNDGSLSYARLANEDGVVLRPARENLDYALKLLLTPNHGIELSLPREVGEIAPESVYCRRLLLLAVLALLRRRFAGVGRS